MKTFKQLHTIALAALFIGAAQYSLAHFHYCVTQPNKILTHSQFDCGGVCTETDTPQEGNCHIDLTYTDGCTDGILKMLPTRVRTNSGATMTSAGCSCYTDYGSWMAGPLVAVNRCQGFNQGY